MSQTILLIMDMINDLVHPDGPAGAAYAPVMARRDVLGRTAALVARARGAGLRVGYVRVGFSADYAQCPPASPVFGPARDKGMFRLGSWGTEVHAALAPQPGNLDFVKHRVSPFYGTALEPTLRALGITRLLLTGVSTNGVVHSGAREAHDRDYAPVVVEDCCAGATDEEHAAAIACVRRFAAIADSAALDLAA